MSFTWNIVFWSRIEVRKSIGEKKFPHFVVNGWQLSLMQMQWGQNEPSPKHGLTHINFKSRSYLLSKKCCASGISLEYFWIIHFRIKAATFILHGSLCIDWLQSIQASEVLIERPKKQGLLTNVYHNRAIQIHTHTHTHTYIYNLHTW